MRRRLLTVAPFIPRMWNVVSAGSEKSHPAVGCFLVASVIIYPPSGYQGDTLYGGYFKL